MRRWLALRLEAPLMAFGGVAVDHVGRSRDFPAASMLVGLIGNALGWHWRDAEAHQAIQDRLVFAARRDREGVALEEVQNAWLGRDDSGWTTDGRPEGRKGSTYDDPHRRRREYHADSLVRVVLALEPEAEEPGLENLAAALDRPARAAVPGPEAVPARRANSCRCRGSGPAVGGGRDGICGAVRASGRAGEIPRAVAGGRGSGCRRRGLYS